MTFLTDFSGEQMNEPAEEEVKPSSGCGAVSPPAVAKVAIFYANRLAYFRLEAGPLFPSLYLFLSPTEFVFNLQLGKIGL